MSAKVQLVFPVILISVVLSLCSSCAEKATGVSLDTPPPAPGGFVVINGDSSVTLRWNFMDEVTPTISFSGYKVFMRDADEEDPFLSTAALDHIAHDNTRLPLIKRHNSLSDEHMEVRILKLKPGVLYEFYVVGIQNGLTGPPTRVVSEIPFRLKERILIRDESEIHSWFYIHELFARYSVIDENLIGYDFNSTDKTHHLIWMPINDGGSLRIQKGGPRRDNEKAPDNGYINEADQGRIELAGGDSFWVWDTRGTLTRPEDDHYARIEVTRIVTNSGARRIEIECAYQARANARNF